MLTSSALIYVVTNETVGNIALFTFTFVAPNCIDTLAIWLFSASVLLAFIDVNTFFTIKAGFADAVERALSVDAVAILLTNIIRDFAFVNVNTSSIDHFEATHAIARIRSDFFHTNLVCTGAHRLVVLIITLGTFWEI